MYGLAIPLFVMGMILLHVLALGGAFVRGLRLHFMDGWTRLAGLGGIGLALFGFEVFVLGEIRALTRIALYASSVAMLLLLLWNCSSERVADSFGLWRGPSGPLQPARRASCELGRRGTVLRAAIVVVFGLVLIACWRPPSEWDEDT
jgi:hypothetical protein